MDFGYNVAIVGATGCLGRELVYRIHEWIPVKELVAYATKPSQGERIDSGDSSIMIQGFGDGFSEEVLSNLHAVIFACPASIVMKWADRLSEEGIAVLDATGVLGTQIGYTVAGVLEHDDDFLAHRMASFPSPSATALVKIWSSLKILEPVQMSSIISVSASRFGKKGIDELAQQVRALLNIQDSPNSVFPDGLAFDILPSIGPDSDGPTIAEQTINQELSNVLQIQPDRFRTRL
jgi:aspartate-semialdehyde dehydrogenase